MSHEAVSSDPSSCVQKHFERNPPPEAAKKISHVFSERLLVFTSRFFLSFGNVSGQNMSTLVVMECAPPPTMRGVSNRWIRKHARGKKVV